MNPNEDGRLFTESIEDEIDTLVARVCAVAPDCDPAQFRRNLRQAIAEEIL